MAKFPDRSLLTCLTLAAVLAAAGLLVGLLPSSAACQEKGGTCVQYVKAQQPQYNKLYTDKKVPWILARELYDLVINSNDLGTYRKRGPYPAVGAVFIMERFSGNDAGHCGIVTEVLRDSANPARVTGFRVKHSNWEPAFAGLVSSGTFKFVAGHGPSDNQPPLQVTYTPASGPSWSTKYDLRGFVYQP